MKKLNRKNLDKYFKELEVIEEKFFDSLSKLEKRMSKEFNRKEGLMFFWCDNEIVGIGNEDRTIKLIHR